MCKACLYGGAASLQPGGMSQLVRVEGHEPASWALELEASAPATFRVTAGSGQASRVFSVEVNGRLTLQVVGQALSVSAVAGAAQAQVQASAAPGTAPERAPDTVTAGLAIGPQVMPASGRLYAIVYNPNAVPVDVGLAGVTLHTLAPGASVRLDWAGAIDLVTAATYNVAEVWR